MPLSPDRKQPMRRRLYLAVAALIAAGYGLTLLIFYPGIMTYDAKFVYEDIAKGVLGDWQSPVMTVLWGADRSDRARRGQHVPADRDLLLAGLWPAGIRAGAPRHPARAVAAAAGAAAAGLRLCRDHLARCAVRDQLAAGRRDRLRRRRTRRAPSRAGAGAGACAVRLRRPAASECADRRADPCRLHRMADADVR